MASEDEDLSYSIEQGYVQTTPEGRILALTLVATGKGGEYTFTDYDFERKVEGYKGQHSGAWWQKDRNGIPGVYAITNRDDPDSCYIGQSQDVARRIRTHLNNSSGFRGKSGYLYEGELLVEVGDKEERLKTERLLIPHVGTLNGKRTRS